MKKPIFFLLLLLIMVRIVSTGAAADAQEPETLIYYFPMIYHMPSPPEEVLVDPVFSHWRMYSRAPTLEEARAGSVEVGVYPRIPPDVWGAFTLPPFPGVRDQYILWRVQGEFDLSHLPANRRIHSAWLELAPAGRYNGTMFEVWESAYLEPDSAAWNATTLLGSVTRSPDDVDQLGVPLPLHMPLPGLAGRFPEGTLGIQLRGEEALAAEMQVTGLFAFGPTTMSGEQTTNYSRLHILLEPPTPNPEVRP
jgi:hypothetical protein